ncbi:MAG: carbohydrate kinase [Actinobacteria bacterium HGW-Actinobacteria-5]|jgi:fructokinase|nr:MAG: carbohydrate kinase [Actinobacteria bacterium HGW-Actinobacteria-5]
MEVPVTVVGEALIDIVIPPTGDAVEHVGGSPANVAIGLARLGHPTRLATHIGPDARGERIAALMEAEGVELAAGSSNAQRTPTAAAHLDAAGVASYEFDLDWQLDPAQVIVPPGGHLHTGSIAATLAPGGAAVLDIVRAARSHATVSYDPNARPTLMGSPDEARPVIERLIGLADVVKASDEDVRWLYGTTPVTQVLAHWASLGPTVCAVTQGGEEVVVLAAGEVQRYPTLPTHVADTVGAGDSFMAGLISGLLDAGLLGDEDARERLRFAEWPTIESAVERALACAAITVSRAGANPPTRADLEIDA